MTNLDLKLQDLDVYNDFIRRHIGPSSADEQAMLTELGMKSLDELVDKVIPETIRRKKTLAVKASRSERQVLDKLYQYQSETNCTSRSLAWAITIPRHRP